MHGPNVLYLAFIIYYRSFVADTKKKRTVAIPVKLILNKQRSTQSAQAAQLVFLFDYCSMAIYYLDIPLQQVY